MDRAGRGARRRRGGAGAHQGRSRRDVPSLPRARHRYVIDDSMAKIKIERMLNLGAAYTPETGAGGKPEPSWATLGEQVREAASLGYDTVVAVETQHDPFLMLAVAAQEPSTLELATGIALAFTKSPVATAYTAWDLQRMSGGRLLLGLGSQVKGHITRRFGVPLTQAAPRMQDYVRA